MLPIERRTEIISLIKRDRSVKVNELSEKFEVTEETIRRDLEKLEKEGILKRTYGGAVLENLVSDDLSYTDREKVNMTQKEQIATYASRLIDEGETIFIDASTTALQVIKHVDETKKITVITNSLNAIRELSPFKNITIVGIGGVLNESTYSFEGSISSKFIDFYFADKTFFSVKGITKERGIMDSRESAVEAKGRMIQNSKQTILVIDESKFDRSAMIRIIDMKEIDVIVTEYDLDDSWVAYFEENDVDVIVAK